MSKKGRVAPPLPQPWSKRLSLWYDEAAPKAGGSSSSGVPFVAESDPAPEAVATTARRSFLEIRHQLDYEDMLWASRSLPATVPADLPCPSKLPLPATIPADLPGPSKQQLPEPAPMPADMICPSKQPLLEPAPLPADACPSKQPLPEPATKPAIQAAADETLALVLELGAVIDVPDDDDVPQTQEDDFPATQIVEDPIVEDLVPAAKSTSSGPSMPAEQFVSSALATGAGVSLAPPAKGQVVVALRSPPPKASAIVAAINRVQPTAYKSKSQSCACTSRDCNICGTAYLSDTPIRRARSRCKQTHEPPMHHIFVWLPRSVQIAGKALQRVEHCIDSLLRLSRPVKFKIGITHHPLWRYWGYWRGGASRLHVLYCSNSYEAVDWCEAHCIQFSKRLIGNGISTMNIKDVGGEGPMAKFPPPYFCYLVVFDGQWSFKYEAERSVAMERAPLKWVEGPRLPKPGPQWPLRRPR